MIPKGLVTHFHRTSEIRGSSTLDSRGERSGLSSQERDKTSNLETHKLCLWLERCQEASGGASSALASRVPALIQTHTQKCEDSLDFPIYSSSSLTSGRNKTIRKAMLFALVVWTVSPCGAHYFCLVPVSFPLPHPVLPRPAKRAVLQHKLLCDLMPSSYFL